ncbi:hypothetical protein Bca52824_016861 [Brassica carinata]|uniref:Uncharacterized protein n=1 Tax=Brassica carinata TaxID=52824 RepID=A0A8X8B6U0_BRACI|nr:hypothetical protein Bca52824_016861 [Brassica carinata]
MAPRKIPAKYSCQEIYDRMSNGLCIFCEDLDTPGHHDLKHKGVKIFVTESDNESIMTESDDKPIAEESYGFVTETVMQPDLFSESLEGSTSDLQVVIAAGQKEAQNKSDSEENMSLSLGNKIEHLVGKHTQKAERVWEPGGLLTKLDMGDGTEKCLTHGQVPVLFVQPARATINRKEMCVIRVWEPDIYGSCEEFEWLLRYGCRETDAATSLLNEVSTHETYPHVDQVYLHVKGLEALPEKITSSNDANVSKRLCEQVPLRVMSTEQCKSLWFSAAMSDVRLTRQLHIQAKELLSEFQNVPRVLVSVSEFGAKIYKPPDPNEKLQHDEILGKFRRAKELMAENSRDTRFLVEGLRNCIQTFEELGKHMTQECSLSASVWDLLTKQSRSCSFFEFLLQWKWYPPEQSYQAFSVWFLRWWTWQKKDKFFASRWLILVERVASPSYIPGQLCIKSTQTHVDVFIRISTEMTSVTNTWRIHDSFQVTVEYKYNGNRDAHKPPVLIKGYGDRNIMESLCSPMNENQSVLHETNHIAFSVWHRWKNKLRSEIYFVELIGNKTRGSKPLAIRQKMLRSHESKLCVCLAETIDVIDEMERSKITDHRQYTQLEFFTVDHVGYSLASVFTYEWYHSPRPPEVLFHNIDCWSSYSSFILEGKDALKKGVL